MREEKLFLIVGLPAWCVAWIILVFKLDLILYIAFLLYGLGISGITIYIILKAIRIDLINKEKVK